MKKKTTEEQMSIAGTEEGRILTLLAERVERAVQVIQELRRERDQLKAQVEELEHFRSERGEIRDRIETILSNLASLEAE